MGKNLIKKMNLKIKEIKKKIKIRIKNRENLKIKNRHQNKDNFLLNKYRAY